MLCCSVTFRGKDNILAFHPFHFLTLGHDFYSFIFYSLYQYYEEMAIFSVCSTQGLKSGVPAGLLLLQGQNLCPSSKTEASS